jgi:hypothetical protein
MVASNVNDILFRNSIFGSVDNSSYGVTKKLQAKDRSIVLHEPPRPYYCKYTIRSQMWYNYPSFLRKEGYVKKIAIPIARRKAESLGFPTVLLINVLVAVAAQIVFMAILFRWFAHEYRTGKELTVETLALHLTIDILATCLITSLTLFLGGLGLKTSRLFTTCGNKIQEAKNAIPYSGIAIIAEGGMRAWGKHQWLAAGAMILMAIIFFLLLDHYEELYGEDAAVWYPKVMLHFFLQAFIFIPLGILMISRIVVVLNP